MAIFFYFLNGLKDESITCSISTQHTGGSFTLKKGSFTEMKSTSGNFTIPYADFSHEGSYCCQYQTTVSNREFTSPQSNTISVSVVGMDTNVCSMFDACLISASQMTLYVYITTHNYWPEVKQHILYIHWQQSYMESTISESNCLACLQFLSLGPRYPHLQEKLPGVNH